MTDHADHTPPNPSPADVRVSQLEESDLFRKVLHAHADHAGGDHAAVESWCHNRDVAAGLFVPDLNALPTERRVITTALAAELALYGTVFVDYAVDGPEKF